MENSTSIFYDSFAEDYHLIFADWDAAIHRQAAVIDTLISNKLDHKPLRILDVSCGIGTQALGLAGRGSIVIACDISEQSINRAKHEAENRNLNIDFKIDDMCKLGNISGTDFDVIIAFDNTLPHLQSGAELHRAAKAALNKLRPGGLYLASIRDYADILIERPTSTEPRVLGEENQQRTIWQEWRWHDDRRYTVEQVISMKTQEKRFKGEYRAFSMDELTNAFEQTGFKSPSWHLPSDTGFYQPIVIAEKPT